MTRSEFALWGPDPSEAPATVPGAQLDPEGRRLAREKAEQDSVIGVRLVAEGYTAGEDVSVAVYSDAERLGRLSAADAVTWLPVVEQIERAGMAPTVPAEFTGGDGDDEVGLRILLNDPALAVPRNAAPRESHTLLPAGAPVSVRVDAPRVGPLRALIPGSGAVAVVLTLHRVLLSGTGPLEPGVEVRIDSRAVGMLDDVDADRLLPVIDHFSRRGLTAAVRGIARQARGPDTPADAGVSVTLSVGTVEGLGPRVLNGPPQPVPSFEPRPRTPPVNARPAPSSAASGESETEQSPDAEPEGPSTSGPSAGAMVLTGVSIVLGGLLVLAAMGAPDGSARAIAVGVILVGVLVSGLWWAGRRRRDRADALAPGR